MVIVKQVLKLGKQVALYSPEEGMNLLSFRKGNMEAIDQTTKSLFDQRKAGLGAMIGPHFHARKKERIPKLRNKEAFPHVAVMEAAHKPDLFSHGVGRYAPWTVVDATATRLKAILKGSDVWHGVPLKEIEGQDFSMEYEANLRPEGLEIFLSCVGDTDAVIGLHTYYALSGRSTVTSTVQGMYNDQGEFKSMPSSWNYNPTTHQFTYPVEGEGDYGFLAAPDMRRGQVELTTESHRVRVQYEGASDQVSWQLWHPSGSTFVCVEPIGAKNPRKLTMSVSRIKILISLEAPI